MAKITNEVLLAEHVASVKAGESAQTFADRIGMKLGSVTQRINSARGDLRDSLYGLIKKREDETVEQYKARVEARVDAIIPLRGRKGERRGERKNFISSLVAQAMAENLDVVGENDGETDAVESNS